MNMKNILRRIRSQAGFTMIELLVVIAVIGVLAVAVLSSINPIEQINKGRDTRKRSNAAQLINAADRFYAIQEQYPWNHETYNGGVTGYTPDLAFPDATYDVCGSTELKSGTTFCLSGGAGYTADSWLTGLADTDEVKQSFVDQVSGTSSTNILYLFKDVDGDLFACFEPASKQFQLEAVDGCASRQSTLPAGACPQASYDPLPEWADELICLP